MNGKGKTILLIIGILFSLAVIGGVFYMVRQQQEVTPTPTPVSTPTPAPANVFEINETDDVCKISFVVPVPGDPTLLCVSKVAWEDEDNNTPTNYTLVTETDTFTPGDIIVYEIKYSSDVIEDFTITDELDANVTFLDSESGCTVDSVTNTVTCDVDVSVEPAGSVLYRVVTDPDLTTTTSIANLATLTNTLEGLSDTCSSTITYTHSASPSPSPSSGNPSPSPSQSSTPTSPAPSVSNPPAASNPAPSTLPQAGIAEITTGTVGIGILLLIIGLAGLLII